MSFQDIGEILTVYYINLQNQLITQAPADVPVSMSGQWLVGANTPPELVEQMTRIQAQRMQEEKLRMGYG